MTILLVPTLSCNLKCAYCFAWRHTHAKPVYNADVGKMVGTLKRIYTPGRSVHLHGGEPLLTPIDDFEYLLSEIYGLTGQTSLQTNLYALTDRHVELFKKFRTNVGVSIDGPYELNRLRGFPDEERYKIYYSRLMDNIEKLRSNKIWVGGICVLSVQNAGSDEKLSKLKEWLEHMYYSYGITFRLNPLFGDGATRKYELSPTRLKEVYRDLFLFSLAKGIPMSPFSDAVKTVFGRPGVCWMAGCDPFNPRTIAILPDGSVTGCDRWFGTMELRPTGGRNVREELLRETECRGCPYFPYCRGGCPREGWPDWRHKTRFCEAYKEIFRIALNIKRYVPVRQGCGPTGKGVRRQVAGRGQ